MSSVNESMLNDIPYGMYCYSIKEIVKDNKQKVLIKTKLCPYYAYLDEGKCKCLLMNIDCSDDVLLNEKLKICGINDEFDKEV